MHQTWWMSVLWNVYQICMWNYCIVRQSYKPHNILENILWILLSEIIERVTFIYVFFLPKICDLYFVQFGWFKHIHTSSCIYIPRQKLNYLFIILIIRSFEIDKKMITSFNLTTKDGTKEI